MDKLLSQNFYTNIKTIVIPRIEDQANKLIIKNIDWENEANNYLLSLIIFFDKINLQDLKENNIDKIGVIDICWNEYGSDIEVDFMSDNDFEKAFYNGCIMNNSAIDNDKFFKTYFNVDGENAWERIGDDYQTIILAFYYLINDIINVVIQQNEFKILPKKTPYHIGFASFHDAERTNIFTKK